MPAVQDNPTPSTPVIKTFTIPGFCTAEITELNRTETKVAVKQDSGEERAFDALKSGSVRITLDPVYSGPLRELTSRNRHNNPDLLLDAKIKSFGEQHSFLIKFIEELYQFTEDPETSDDADQLLEELDSYSLFGLRPKPFVSGSGTLISDFARWCMPPKPERQIIFGFGELRHRLRINHYIIALPALVFAITTINLLLIYLPWTNLSLLTGVERSFNAFGIVRTLGVIAVIAAVQVAYIVIKKSFVKSQDTSDNTFGLMNRIVVWEEQKFREGAEDWTFFQRVRSCLVFGFNHYTNFWYPIAALFTLSFAGAYFMWVYLKEISTGADRREAVLEAALVHRAYNRVLMFLIPFVVFFSTDSWLIRIVFVGALSWFLINDRIKDRQRNQKLRLTS